MKSIICAFAILSVLFNVNIVKAAPFQSTGSAIEQQVIYGDKAFALAINILVRNHEYQKALDLLESRLDITNQANGLKLRVQLLIELGRLSEALLLLETYVADNPNDAVTRFQIGEIQFKRQNDKAAANAYRLALAGVLAPHQIEIANARLGAIKGRRPVHYNLNAAIVPDSNINSATKNFEVEIFGLPFTLDENARRKAGVAWELNAGIERTAKIDAYSLSRTSLYANVLDAEGGAFDTVSLGATTSIEAQMNHKLTLSVRGTYNSVWFAGSYLENALGAGLEADYYANNIRWTSSLSTRLINGTSANRRAGTGNNFELTRTKYLGPSALWQISIAHAARDQKDLSQSYSQDLIAIGRLFPTPLRTNTFVQATALERNYLSGTYAFGDARRDKEINVSMRITKPNWTFMQAHPFIVVEYSNNHSNQSLNAYERKRMQFGLSYEF